MRLWRIRKATNQEKAKIWLNSVEADSGETIYPVVMPKLASFYRLIFPLAVRGRLSTNRKSTGTL